MSKAMLRDSDAFKAMRPFEFNSVCAKYPRRGLLLMML